MGSKLFIFIEGDDDERFFNRIIKPMFENKYEVHLWKYAQKKNEKIFQFLNSIQAMNDADYIYVADNNGSPCITDRKQRIENDFKNIDKNKILVVVREIEGWYLAGIDEGSSKKFGIKSFHNTEHINKSAFNDVKPKKFSSRIDFMSEILKLFCIDTAKKKNGSFSYFVENYI
ncbi:MAG: hypothetical protein MPEBLZ_00590 [Candidatus Methanoperedens nitroreducens]|uniref:DUF4276 domain-containing protein n=1 Tax=Candidatus Methanoperedens nitratireducens TaxID=1392998 RepID=A0A0P8A971_9EURY|nr:hypothetical protein [Candidatus Methanoperedens sp. BLZ2]KAB2945381.1 MAG: DUF4276 family protein [Candidatus Methanoperedens sp.]KPQ44832.1 MAG: hypothetical protein MPEBLZ_00590 [Candidatus Methanoperedens sp. BLZ1]MBZ0177359.1 DUF4276 family protein [Candidatus Methanoperedens nitroreducens]CAG0971714.1 hypothetical protein METP2_01436 [Methanosarcinales archaeon]MCX9077789.1 hypothetical protein [Candidatus Methanoperedens sp.]